MEYLPLISLLTNVALPPLINLAKSLFGIKDTPQNTLSTLATTKPEVLPEYVKASAILLEAETKYFNRDVTGTPSQWVVDLRASIRPISVFVSFVIFLIDFIPGTEISKSILIATDGVIGNWLGTKIEFHK